MPRKHKRKLEDVQAGVKYHEIYHAKRTKTQEEGEKKRRKE